MEEILTGYEISQATWFYHSLVLTLAVFFKFNRLWSLRNLDLVLLLSLSPGLILVRQAEAAGATADAMLGYGWLFTVTLLLVIRLLLDGSLKRRPRLEQNMNSQGMLFLGVAAFVFLMTEAIIESPPGLETQPAVKTVVLGGSDLKLSGGEASSIDPEVPAPTMKMLEDTSNALSKQVGRQAHDPYAIQLLTARLMAILAHVAVLSGLLVVGHRLFGDLQLGLAMATIYLLLPCTAFDVHKADHVIPAALIIWAIAVYRKPLVAGALLGLACGAVLFPIFLLPLWVSFYGRKGAFKFIASLLFTGAVLLAGLMLTWNSSSPFARELVSQILTSFLDLWNQGDTNGFWALVVDNWYYRLPVFVCFLMMVITLTFRPGQRTLEHLIADSAVVVVGTQLWYPQTGGVHLLWYLPLLLLVIFRPRLMHLLPPEAELERTVSVKLMSLPNGTTKDAVHSRTHLFQ